MFLFGIRLGRSQSFTLTLSFWSACDVRKHPLLALISAHAPTLKNLRVCIPTASFQELSGCRGCLDQLSHPILESHEQLSWPMDWTIHTFEYAPKLQVLNTIPILHFPDVMELPWSQLIYYSLQIDNTLGLKQLRRVEKVKSLDIRNRELFRMFEGYKHISLPYLTSLKLTSQNTTVLLPGVRTIFSALSIPNLVDLHFVYSGVPGFPYIKTPNIITSLTITQLSSSTESYSTFNGLPAILSEVPNLQRLTLKSVGALSLTDISSLNPSPASRPLPHLQTLDISGCKLNFEHSIFVEIIKARRQGRNPENDQVEIVYLGSFLMLGFPPTEFGAICLKKG
ncbi:hypothetical protein DFS33DRAFT_524735 [Desarmillaria ectypa]|nr:hypothetical protein DFS33DRAFT_524735 [Desarmillaria ectypa]